MLYHGYFISDRYPFRQVYQVCTLGCSWYVPVLNGLNCAHLCPVPGIQSITCFGEHIFSQIAHVWRSSIWSYIQMLASLGIWCSFCSPVWQHAAVLKLDR